MASAESCEFDDRRVSAVSEDETKISMGSCFPLLGMKCWNLLPFSFNLSTELVES